MQSILVCDDDKQIVEAIDIYLTGEGFEVIKAYDGAEALELLKTHTVNLMILDVMMPGLDGIRTTLKVRETSSISIIILSAKSEDADKILGLNIGADDYITKPFNPLELVARVKSQLRRYTQLGNTTSCFCSLKTPEKSSPSTRSTRRSGMRRRSARTIQLRFISAISAKRSKLTRGSRAI